MIGDTIWAVASAAGRGPRGVIRISGPDALAAARRLGPVPAARGAHEVTLTVVGFPVDALVLVMPVPRSFTGEDVVELHLPGSPALWTEVGASLAPLARPATPGEFSRRAFEHGRLDLTAAEGVLALIHAESLTDARRALAAVTGGLSRTVERIRAELDDARGLLEAGLDFEDEDTGAVDPELWLPAVRAADARLAALVAELPRGRPGGDLVLLGRTNAGKSSLFNALCGADRALVSARAATTRDLLVAELEGGTRIVDAPGDVGVGSAVDAEAVALRDRRIAAAAGVILVLDPTHGGSWPDAGTLAVVARVATRADRAPDAVLPPTPDDAVPTFRVGLPPARAPLGIDRLAAFLAERGGGSGVDPAARIAARLTAARVALGRALAVPDAAGELVAFELGEAVVALDDVHGRSSPEDLLDRVFGRFCLGK